MSSTSLRGRPRFRFVMPSAGCSVCVFRLPGGRPTGRDGPAGGFSMRGLPAFRRSVLAKAAAAVSDVKDSANTNGIGCWASESEDPAFSSSIFHYSVVETSMNLGSRRGKRDAN